MSFHNSILNSVIIFKVFRCDTVERILTLCWMLLYKYVPPYLLLSHSWTEACFAEGIAQDGFVISDLYSSIISLDCLIIFSFTNISDVRNTLRKYTCIEKYILLQTHDLVYERQGVHLWVIMAYNMYIIKIHRYECGGK